jgi:hypothetical protein
MTKLKTQSNSTVIDFKADLAAAKVGTVTDFKATFKLQVLKLQVMVGLSQPLKLARCNR